MNGKFALLFVALFTICHAAPSPWFHHHKKHVRIHVPYEVHTVHHHHVEKIPIYKEIPVIKEIPIIKHVPIVKHVPIIKEVPVIKHVPIYKEIHVPHHEEWQPHVESYGGWW